MVWQPTDTRDALVWTGFIGEGGYQEFSSGHIELRCLFDTHMGWVGNCTEFSCTEARSVSERLCISCICGIRKPWDCLGLTKGWEYVQKRRRSWTEICGIKGSGEEEARRHQLRSLSEKWPAALHTKSVESQEPCEAKCIEGELVVNYAQNADAQWNKRKIDHWN